jgi:hypothetical protein
MAAKASSQLARSLKGGVAAGFIAGLVLSGLLIISMLIQDMDPWMAIKGTSAPFLGERALQPGFDAFSVALGAVLHLAISMLWGLGFGILFYGLSRGGTLVAGAVWGIVVWLVMYYAVLPLAGLSEMVAETPVWRAVVAHVFFGLLLALAFLPFQRRVVRRAPAPTATPSIRTS